MIALALKLIEAGAGDYWDEVDRWVRNMFAEGQMTRCDWMDRMGFRQPHVPIEPMYQTDERVAERNLGAFGGWLSPNDFFGARVGGGHDIFMHCCTGNSTRTLYYVWDNILHCDSGRLRVNLLLNRASPWADVDSHLPYTGRVDVRVKQACDLALRIPEWVQPGQAVGRVNDEARPLRWDGRYAQLGSLCRGDVATLTFPIEERTVRVRFEREPYTLVRKGNEVVLIDPPGRYAPLYQRDHYRNNETRWRMIERFVADKPLHW
jgi:hypothetical protein